MEKYLVSLELARKLKEADFPQDTYWFVRHQKPTGRTKLYWKGDMDYDNERFSGNKPEQIRFRDENEFFAAPMTDELLEQFPDKVRDSYVKMEIRHIGKHTFMPMLVEERMPENVPAEYHPDYDELAFDENDDPLKRIDTRPNALAQLWLWCKENGYV